MVWVRISGPNTWNHIGRHIINVILMLLETSVTLRFYCICFEIWYVFVVIFSFMYALCTLKINYYKTQNLKPNIWFLVFKVFSHFNILFHDINFLSKRETDYLNTFETFQCFYYAWVIIRSVKCDFDKDSFAMLTP